MDLDARQTHSRTLDSTWHATRKERARIWRFFCIYQIEAFLIHVFFRDFGSPHTQASANTLKKKLRTLTLSARLFVSISGFLSDTKKVLDTEVNLMSRVQKSLRLLPGSYSFFSIVEMLVRCSLNLLELNFTTKAELESLTVKTLNLMRWKFYAKELSFLFWTNFGWLREPPCELSSSWERISHAHTNPRSTALTCIYRSIVVCIVKDILTTHSLVAYIYASAAQQRLFFTISRTRSTSVFLSLLCAPPLTVILNLKLEKCI